ncbi:LacI family DNA-binding transcriptional regulator [Streptomyces sp. NPDC000941]
MARRRTLAEIAAEAGVSLPTVSKVLHGRSDVSVETRGKVRRLLQSYGYPEPGRAAQSGGQVEFVINELDNPWATELIRGAEEALESERLGLVVSAVHKSRALADNWAEAVQARGSLGAILALSELSPAQEDELRGKGIPFVIVQPATDTSPASPSVGSTNWPGAYAATRHLTELGHRRIAAIAGPAGRLTTRTRLHGYRAALADAGLPEDPELIRHGTYARGPAMAEMHALLDLADPPTAVFAGNDVQALGVYRALRDRGLTVPDDVSVVGFDDLPFTQWITPELTTVRQPLAEMAALAARMVVRLARGEQPEVVNLELPTALVVRESTGPGPAR